MLNNIKNKVASLPVVGYISKVIWGIFILPKKNARSNEILTTLQLQIGDIKKSVDNSLEKTSLLKKDYEEYREMLSERMKQLNSQLSDIRHQQLLLEKGTKNFKSEVIIPSDTSTNLLVDDHGLDEFYVAFENKFRGTENEIERRLKIYLPYFNKLRIDFKKTPVLDIGCGRGEMLSVLNKADIDAIGIDLNEQMVNKARANGYQAEQADALTYLMSKKSNSYGAITGFHLAEHIPFQLLIRIFDEAYRVLAPGGILIFETPNPENIHVGSFSFYYDPSHLNPLPPDVLAFTLENRGYDKAEILRLHPKRTNIKIIKDNADLNEIAERFYGPQDYAVIGYKSE